MTKQIHRMQLLMGRHEIFAPSNVTFAYQPARQAFSLWYLSTDDKNTRYRMIATGESVYGVKKIRASAVMEDGFTVIHLVEVE